MHAALFRFGVARQKSRLQSGGIFFCAAVRRASLNCVRLETLCVYAH